MKFFRYIIVSAVACFCFDTACAQTYRLLSPDKKLELTLTVNDTITYAVAYKKVKLIDPSTIALTLDKQTLGKAASVIKTSTSTVNKIIKPLYGKNDVLTDHYNQLRIHFKNDYSLVLRAYNEGAAYRFVTKLSDSVKVLNEKAEFNLAGSPGAILPQTDNYTAWEVPYVAYTNIDSVKQQQRALTPSLFSFSKNGINAIVAEADVYNYPGMYIKKQGSGFVGNWAAYPAVAVMGSWGDFVSVVKERKEYIAQTTGTRAYPWRVVIATDDDRTLLTNELIYKLSEPSALKNTAWIKPGKATWEWWHDAMLPGADIPSGMANRNTALYKYYVDFAAKNKLEYLMIDAGWSNNHDVTKVNPKVDVKELITYADKKNVGVFLWCVASPLLKDLDNNLDFIKQLGAKGIKVDFFDRDDQQAIEWMEAIAKAAAERHLMVNFHGCAKPTGMQRKYPNIVNYEAVRGEECSKWDHTANPQHHLTFPFIRMLGGPLDYTPGSMRNATMQTFKPIDPGLPSSLGTRCHELAMYVVFDQPFAMLSDSPKEYEKYPHIMRYLAAVPTTFNQTKVLDAKVGEYAVVAKRKDSEWFVGAMTNWDEKSIKLNFAFLPEGKTYVADVYTDGADADTVATGYSLKTMPVTSKTTININMAKGGGAAMHIRPK
ncbi:glycoside hydrolase family 97 protein [Mucilaginibacter sp. JRF]|uniref:glycoside hydrolase family 97 protein n=1 Tax=Mucilaginibacter sp. JRF TaxID=2780088 RepID=UPI001880A5AF|nr:glycoside hydrolase family 97 protein [Mucilaginibacter sp. JRF]MBE9583217.1 glycoside hydrolase family 97 protein [Mucilaginibacter sp. JRF]